MRELLYRDGLIAAPAAHDALAARIIEEAGYEAVYVGGYNTAAAAFALPDWGLLTFNELATQVERISGAVSRPVIVDADFGFSLKMTGFRRALQALHSAGASAIQIEDSLAGKHDGADAELMPAETMAERVACARSFLPSPCVLIARTDALWATKSLEEAVRRVNLYARGGADMVFIAALRSQAVADVVPSLAAPLANIAYPLTSRHEAWEAEKLEQAGLKLLIYSVELLLLAFAALRSAAAELGSAGYARLVAALPPLADLERRLSPGVGH